MNDTITSNSISKENYLSAADDILGIINDFNFYTDTSFDPRDLKNKIILAIQKNVEKNVEKNDNDIQNQRI